MEMYSYVPVFGGVAMKTSVGLGTIANICRIASSENTSCSVMGGKDPTRLLESC